MLEMIAWNQINLPDPGLVSTAVVHFRCLSFDLGLMAVIANAIEEHIKNQTKSMESLSGLRLHTISIGTFPTPCTAHFAILPSLTEFRKHGRVINTGVRFMAPIFS